jgi:hypothetical protein
LTLPPNFLAPSTKSPPKLYMVCFRRRGVWSWAPRKKIWWWGLFGEDGNFGCWPYCVWIHYRV